MDRMFKVLGFWALVISLLFLAGELYIPAGLSIVQAILFIWLGSLRFTEKTYMYIFGGYMFISFIGMVFYSTFYM